MLDLGRLDLDEIAVALADQTDYEHRWLINPHTGEVVFWTSDTGIDGQNPVELDELDLLGIDPLPSYVWYQDMADFAEQISDERAGRRLARAIDGRGAFSRFRAELHDEYPSAARVVRLSGFTREAPSRRMARRELSDRRRLGRSFPHRILRSRAALNSPLDYQPLPDRPRSGSDDGLGGAMLI